MVQSDVLMHNKMCFHITDHASEIQTLQTKIFHVMQYAEEVPKKC